MARHRLPHVRVPPDRVLHAMYARAIADARANEPGERLITFAAFKKLVRLQMQLAATDPGGNIDLGAPAAAGLATVSPRGLTGGHAGAPIRAFDPLPALDFAGSLTSPLVQANPFALALPTMPRSAGNRLEDKLILEGTKAALGEVPVIGPALAYAAPLVAPLVESAVDVLGSGAGKLGSAIVDFFGGGYTRPPAPFASDQSFIGSGAGEDDPSSGGKLRLQR